MPASGVNLLLGLQYGPYVFSRLTKKEKNQTYFFVDRSSYSMSL